MKRTTNKSRIIIAGLLVAYIVFSTSYVINDFSETRHQKAITGNAIGQVAINIVSRCNLNLVTEYNFISLCSNLTNSSVASVLSSIDGKYAFVLRWNRSSQEFDPYSPEAASNSFSRLRVNESYFIFMTEASSLNIPGSSVGDLNISLQREHNTPSYPYRVTTNISNYINPIRENVSFVLTWNKTAQEFTTYSPEAAANQINRIGTGEGQFIFLTTANTFLRYNRSRL